LQDPPKFIQIVSFGLKICRLATEHSIALAEKSGSSFSTGISGELPRKLFYGLASTGRPDWANFRPKG
jgi:hypothetical protein